MNIVFWFLVILVVTFAWMLISFVFHPLGNLLYKFWKNTKDNMLKDDKDEKKD